MTTDRIYSVPGVSFQYYPRLLGFWVLRAKTRSFYMSDRYQTLGWGFAVSPASAVQRAERIREQHGALQRPPEVANG